MMSFSARVPRFLVGMSVLILALAQSGCGEKPPASGKAGKGKGAGGPAPVIVGQVQKKIVPLVIEAIGAVEPIRTTAIRSQVTGILTKIAIQEGQNVKEGDLLSVMSAGAYGAVMASTYNSRPLIPEVLVDGSRWHVIRPRKSIDELIALDSVPDWV